MTHLPPCRWLVGAALGLYLYVGLPPTAVLFYELHHLTGIGWIYWGYSFFKAAGYYFGTFDYRLIVCVAVALLVAAPWPTWWHALRGRGVPA